MNVVCRIRFPHTPDTSELYMRYDGGTSLNCSIEHPEVLFTRNGTLSLNTYFNSFYEKFYAKYTKLESLYYLLKLEGDFQVTLYREQYDRENRELIHLETYKNCQPSEPVQISLPNLGHSEDSGRVYLEISCLSDGGSFIDGFLATEQPKIREVSLGIITCTFKKEAYVKNTVNNILNDNFLLKNNKFNIFVVDNGKTLKKDEFNNPIIKLIHNKNLGGSGGFTRGLVEALQEDKYTHFLFMDDDIELNSESIYRLFSLYEYANQDFAVAGSWLDLVKKHRLYEAGAFYGTSNDARGYQLFSVNPFKRDIDLQNSNSLNSLLLEEDLDYGGFWFFSCSKEVVEKIGLLMPFFIQRDDIEFCLRVKEYAKKPIIIFPPISVWHEPPYSITKQPTWLVYYMWRNNLITCSIHGGLKYTMIIKKMLQNLIIDLLYFNYNSAAMLVKALEDFIKGPVFIQDNDAETLHLNHLELSKRYDKPAVNYDNYALEQFYQLPPSGLKRILSLLTLNGHFIPSFLIKNSEALVIFAPGRSKEWVKPFACKKVIIFKEDKKTLHQYELNHWAGIELLGKFLKATLAGAIKWSYVNAKWKSTSKDLVSFNFWKKYLDSVNKVAV